MFIQFPNFPQFSVVCAYVADCSYLVALLGFVAINKQVERAFSATSRKQE
jgi:hypothetical protein